MPEPDVTPILELLRPQLSNPALSDSKPIVVMTCGIAGAGKTTLSRGIVSTFPNFTRVSIDAIIAARHGLYNIDYPASKHDEYELEADAVYEETFMQLIREGKNVMLDRSFYAREDREYFKALVEQEGGRWVLVFLKAEKDVLWRRICERRLKGVNADCALDISEELLARYFEGFEAPQGEGETVIEVS